MLRIFSSVTKGNNFLNVATIARGGTPTRLNRNFVFQKKNLYTEYKRESESLPPRILLTDRLLGLVCASEAIHTSPIIAIKQSHYRFFVEFLKQLSLLS